MNRLREDIEELNKLVIIAVCRFALRLMYVFPIQGNRVMMMSGWDGLSGNLRCIAEELLARDSSLELIWSLSNSIEEPHFPGIRCVKYRSPSWFYYALTSKVVLVDGGFSRLLPKRKGQIFVNTWHSGGAYKKDGAEKSGRMNKLVLHSYESNNNRANLYLSSSELFSQHSISKGFRYHGEILNCGLPRNDLLFSEEQRRAASEVVKARYGIEDCYVVLYAPTFRGARAKDYHMKLGFPYPIVFSALQERFGKPVAILKRAHPGCVLEDSPSGCVIDVTEDPDMQKLLCAADLLITDYSSSIWDFALLGRPCLLYAVDLEEYEAERGIYRPIQEWPGIVCRSSEALADAIRELDVDACAADARNYLKASGSYETGTATKQACDWIEKKLNLAGREEVEFGIESIGK